MLNALVVHIIIADPEHAQTRITASYVDLVGCSVVLGQVEASCGQHLVIVLDADVIAAIEAPDAGGASAGSRGQHLIGSPLAIQQGLDLLA